jgi:hypothetical protein
MYISELRLNLAYIFELVPTNVRITSDDDVFADTDIITSWYQVSDNDSLLSQMVRDITNICRTPSEIIIIDLYPQDIPGSFKFKFIVRQ